MVLFQRLVLIIVLVRGSMQMIWFCQTIIPARDPEHCGRSKQIMYSYVDDDVNVEDDVDDDGDGDDDGGDDEEEDEEEDDDDDADDDDDDGGGGGVVVGGGGDGDGDMMMLMMMMLMMMMMRRRRMRRRRRMGRRMRACAVEMRMDIHKSHFVLKFTGKSSMPRPGTSFCEQRALTITVRTRQCGYTVWGKKGY